MSSRGPERPLMSSKRRGCVGFHVLPVSQLFMICGWGWWGISASMDVYLQKYTREAAVINKCTVNGRSIISCSCKM